MGNKKRVQNELDFIANVVENHDDRISNLENHNARKFKTVGLSFGQAINELKQGQTVAREGWNGQGIFLKIQVPDENSFMTAPYIHIDTTKLNTTNPAAPTVRVPWLASQTDMLSDDWFIA